MPLENLEIFGTSLIHYYRLGDMMIRLLLDLMVIYIIIGKIFYPRYKQINLFFSYFLVNISVFLVCILLGNMQVKIGFAFGLFAVFSIIRYRTEPIPIKEMTYLFVTIIVSLLNALPVSNVTYAELLLSNGIVIALVYVLERKFLTSGHSAKRVRYEKIELIVPERRAEMIEDLKKRTGLDVTDFHIEDIDFLNDSAHIKVFYRERFPRL